MGETITSPEAIEKKTFANVSEYLSAFEDSPQFTSALAERKKELAIEKPNVQLENDDLAHSLRLSPNYRLALIDFYRAGNILPTDLGTYSEEARKAIKDYWNYIKLMPNHIDVIKATARDRDAEEIRLFRMEKERDRFHTLAGLALLGDGVTLANGQRITCDEIDSESDSALDLTNYSVLGRTLVSTITEENHLDIVEPNREEAKTAATLNFLNGCRYSSGHWVAKGER